MKRILLIFTVLSLIISCNDDDADLFGVAVSFYPSQVANAVEEDGVTYRIQLEASGFVGQQEAFADVSVDLSAEGAIFTDPPLTNGNIRVPLLQDTIETPNGPRAEVLGIIEVLVLNDAIPDDYDAVFTITGVGGAINSISRANTFTLKVNDDDIAPLFTEDFENGLGSWTIVNVDGNNTWTTTSFQGNTSALSSTFNSTDAEAEDNWLISPSIDFDSEENVSLSFLSKTRFNDEENRLEVSVITNFDGTNPLDATQTILSPALDPHTGGGFGDFTESGLLSLNMINGIGHIAFRFKAVSAIDASGWEVDDVEVSSFNPDGSGGGSGGGGEEPVCMLGSGVVFEEDFENGVDDWEIFNPDGNNTWTTTVFQDNTSALTSTFNSAAPGDEDNWLISPSIDFDQFSNEIVNFQSKTRFNDFNNAVDVLILNNYSGSGDPSGADITTLEPTLDPHTGGGFGNFTASGDLGICDITGIGYLAFRFTAVSAEDGAGWEIDDIKIFTTDDVGSGGGGSGSGEFFTLPFFDDFEACTDNFATPANWIEEFVPGSKTDRGWGCRQEGVDGSRAVRASAFGGEAGTDNAWLITANKLDLTMESSAFLSFDIKSQFDGPGELVVQFSENYTSGDPSLATWTELSEVAAQLPAKGTATYTSVSASLAQAVGKQVYIAFQYSGGMNDDSGSYEIDNVSFSSSQAANTTVGFNTSSSSQNEIDATFSVDIPVTLSNFSGSSVSLSVSVTGGTAESGDFTLNTSMLSFSGNGTENVNISINDDADADDETVEITIAESTSTGVSITSAVHTLSITDDDVAANLVLEDGFEGCSAQFGVPGGWIEEVVPGSKTDRGWGCRDDQERNGTYAVRASSFGGSAGTDNTYLIYATQVDFDAQANEELSFWAKSQFSGAGTLTFEYSSDYSGSGDPSVATWTKVSISLPAQGENTFAEVVADLSGITGTVYLAFHFEGAANDDSVSWDIDDLKITGE
ncbi:MAG: choice-of-anchor J domain-containing protein, partial [Bacteroidota bacterium]